MVEVEVMSLRGDGDEARSANIIWNSGARQFVGLADPQIRVQRKVTGFGEYTDESGLVVAAPDGDDNTGSMPCHSSSPLRFELGGAKSFPLQLTIIGYSENFQCWVTQPNSSRLSRSR